MRKVFSSQRLENVEAVAELLRKEGIAVKISNGRSYRSSRRANFSYDSRRMPEELPSVWIVHSEDQPRGRQLLRELGLLESTRDPAASYLPTGRHSETSGGKAGWFSSKRIKLGLLLLIAGGIALIVVGPRKQAPEVATAKPAAPVIDAAQPLLVPEAITELQVYRSEMPTALAATLINDVLARRKPARACIDIDGGDPKPALLQALSAGKTSLLPASTCPGQGALAISVRDYMTDGSGSGKVTVQAGKTSRTLDVERTGTRWQVLTHH